MLPVPIADSPAVEGLLDLLHWVAGVSYYKAAIPQHLVCETGAPPLAAARLLSALYSEGLGEFAVVNGLERLPQPAVPARHRGGSGAGASHARARPGAGRRRQGLSAVAIEIARAQRPRDGAVLARRRAADQRDGKGGRAAAPRRHAHDRPAPARAERSGRAERPRSDHRDRQLRRAADGGDPGLSTRSRWRTNARPRPATSSSTASRSTTSSRRVARAELLLADAVAEIPGAPADLLDPAPGLRASRSPRLSPSSSSTTPCSRAAIASSDSIPTSGSAPGAVTATNAASCS